MTTTTTYIIEVEASSEVEAARRLRRLVAGRHPHLWVTAFFLCGLGLGVLSRGPL